MISRVVVRVENGGLLPPDEVSVFELPRPGWTGKVSISIVNGRIGPLHTKAIEERVICAQCRTSAHIVGVEIETGIRRRADREGMEAREGEAKE